MVTCPVTLSTDSTLIPKSGTDGEKSSAEALPEFSFTPKAFLDTPTIFTSVFIAVVLNALLVNAVRFTVNGDVLEGASTTLEA